MKFLNFTFLVHVVIGSYDSVLKLHLSCFLVLNVETGEKYLGKKELREIFIFHITTTKC